MSNSVVYDAHSGAIHSVTVFQQNRADVSSVYSAGASIDERSPQINRRIEVEVKKGQNQVIIKHLPSWLDQDSIRVDGIGDAVIFDVVYSESLLLHPAKAEPWQNLQQLLQPP